MAEQTQNKETLVITGAAGQLGRHCSARLSYHYGYNVIDIDRNLFSDFDALASSLEKADVVLHLAGVNRGDDETVRSGNLDIARQLIQACESVTAAPHIIYASTIQVNNESTYGKVKREVGHKIKAYCDSVKALYSALVLPNLFGELSKPYYNNFTATFCDQIVEGKPLTIHNDSKVTLLHYGQVADLVADVIESNHHGDLAVSNGEETSVQTVADKLQSLYDTYKTGQLPDLRDPFDLRLFNTLRVRMFDTHFPMSLVRHADARGSFFECVRAENPGQTSFSTTVPGITRGDHFHFDKVERFIVLSGKARIRVRNIFGTDTYEFDVNGNEPCFIDMPPLHTHNITNTGDNELLTLFWSHDFFDPKRTDTYSEAV